MLNTARLYPIGLVAAAAVVSLASCAKDEPGSPPSVSSARQAVLLDEKLLSPSSTSMAEYGRSVATDGVRVVVGEPFGAEVGAAHVYAFDDANGWFLEDTLLPDADADYGFGGSVAIDGVTIVVGGDRFSPVDAVKVFRLQGSSWLFETDLTPFTTLTEQAFGASIAVSGDWIAVGAPAQGAESRVYLYRRVGSVWEPTIEVEPPAATDVEEFGTAVAMDVGYLAVSDPVAFHATGGVGVVHFFRRTNNQATLEAQQWNPDDWQHEYGSALALRGEDALIGSPAMMGMSAAGSVYLHRRSGGAWSQVAELVSPDSAVDDDFGASLDLNALGQLAVVGAPGMPNGGAAYLFENDAGWGSTESIVGLNASSQARFGASVALAGDRVVIGGPSDAEAGTKAGAAWVYSQEGAAGAGGVGGASGAGGVGGTAGTAGVGGTAGTAGVGGTAGTAGQGGASGATGVGGTAGSVGGQAGAAGSGGTPGTGGTGGASTAGNDSVDGKSSGFYACTASATATSHGAWWAWLLLLPWARRRR